MSMQPAANTSPAEKATSFNRVWLLGSVVFVIVLLCLSCLVFMVARYKVTLAAYAWVGSVNNDKVTAASDMICKGSQAEQFSKVFAKRYGRGVKLSLTKFEERDNQVRLEGQMQTRSGRANYEAVFYMGGQRAGMLGLLRCVERIEQRRPDLLPISNWGG
jgi:hypothetical protein